MIGRRTLLAYGTAALAMRAARAADLSSLRRFAELRSRLQGELILPSDDDYEEARRVGSFNPSTDRRPAIIVRCNDPADVARAIEFAQHASLEIAVRSGGNDVLGQSVCEGGMVIDLSRLRRIEIDAAARVARLGAGVRARELNGAAEPFRLAPVLACHPDLGVSGLTLGGGLGWLAGTQGAACDHLIGADVVSADGRQLRATADENPDLFWALRGGGGNFGIVTGMDLALVSLDGVLGGAIAFRADVASFLRFYRDFMQAAPDPLTVELLILAAERPVILALACWSGSPDDGERVLRPLRSFAPPVFDSIRLVPYAHLTDSPGPLAVLWKALRELLENPAAAVKTVRSLAAAKSPPRYSIWRGGSLDDLSDSAIDRLAAILASAVPGGSVGIGHFMHGEICRARRAATPLLRRPGQFTYFVSARWNDATQSEAAMEWVIASFSAMRGISARGTYVNYLSDDAECAVADSYGDNYARLKAVKRVYDAANVFHLNRNIRP